MKFKKMSNYRIVFILMLLICSCKSNNWKTVELGRFLLDVPQNFNFKHQVGIDSEGGVITNDTIIFFANYGRYTDTLFPTPQQYLARHYFVNDAQGQFMKAGIVYDNNNYPKIEVISIRPATAKDSDKIHFYGGADYIATCRHKNKEFKWPIRLPTDIKKHTIKEDSVNHMYRRIAVPHQGYKGMTAIYLRDKLKAGESSYDCYAIVIGADSLTAKQQALALKIYNTLRHK